MKYGEGHKNNYQILAQRLKDIDFEKTAPHLGLKYNENKKIEVNFLNKLYLVDENGVEPQGDQAEDPVIKSLIAGYIFYQGSGEPQNSFVTLGQLTGPIQGPYKSANIKVMEDFAQHFSAKIKDLKKLILKFKGQEEKSNSESEHSWIFTPLPKIPLKLIFSKADEEFPAEARILLDVTATKFLDIEFLGVLCDIFIENLIIENQENKS